GTTSVKATSEGITGYASLTVSILPPTSGGCTNEPAGFSTRTDYDVGGQTIPTRSDCSFGTGGWSVLNPNGNISSLSDAAGTPLSAPWDGQWRYPAGFVGGSAPGTMYYAGLNGSRDLYVGYWWKPSNPWQGHYTNVNKISFLFAGDGGSGKLSEAIMYGAPGGPYKLRIILEFYTSDSHGSGSRWLTPNASNDNVVLGQWHKIEIHYRHSSSTTSQDGVVQW